MPQSIVVSAGFARKISKVPGLLPGERVVDAAYTMGRFALQMADVAGGADYTEDVDAAAGPARGQGMAAPVGKHNGIVALTDRRLLWCEVKTALFRPKDIDAAFPLDDVRDVRSEKETLTIEFRDGSKAAVYATERLSGPFVEAFRALRGSAGTS